VSKSILDMPSLFPTLGSSRKGRFADLDSDKLRGGYYTSPEVASWLCSWAIRSVKETVLEPSCGNGVFLTAAARRYEELGARPQGTVKRLTGVEFVDEEAKSARAAVTVLLGKIGAGVVRTGDFFEWWQANLRTKFDAVIGNPPFIRYQTFPEPHRSLAMAIMAQQGLTPNKLTNIWVPFVVAAAASLRAGGRLALVLPAEILQVTYAAQLRSFLTDRFARIDIVACNELFFEKAEQEVVLLLADEALPAASAANTCSVTMTEAKTVSEITGRSPMTVLAHAQPKTLQHDNEKWLKYFLTNREITFMRALRDAGITTNLSTHASVDVGVVTGKNEFFVLTSSQVAELGLKKYTTPLISRSVHLKGARIRKADWNAMAEAGDRVHLLHVEPSKDKPTGPLGRYIRFGEGHEVHKGYKCSIRPTWY
jgi:adenine-specific DNA methylase